MNNWINVNDRLPPIDQEVLIFDQDCCSVGYLVGVHNSGKQEWIVDSEGLSPDHWQPLPEAPNKEVEQKSDGIISPISLSFSEIERKLLAYKSKSEYKQAAIIMMRTIFSEYED